VRTGPPDVLFGPSCKGPQEAGAGTVQGLAVHTRSAQLRAAKRIPRGWVRNREGSCPSVPVRSSHPRGWEPPSSGRPDVTWSGGANGSGWPRSRPFPRRLRPPSR